MNRQEYEQARREWEGDMSERNRARKHGDSLRRELAAYGLRETLRASARPAFNRPAWEAAAVGVLGGVLIAFAQLAGLL